MPDTGAFRRSASRTEIVLAFAAVYVLWGSTYLAIRFGVETLPPVLMAGLRDSVGIMVGGAPVTQGFADDMGADGYGKDAVACVDLARSLIAERAGAHA